MQLHLQYAGSNFMLRGADGRHALVNDQHLQHSFVIAPDRLIENWPVRDVRALTPQDLEPLLALEPEVILLGTGATQAFPPAQALAACLRRGVGLDAMSNDAAARTFNVLAAEDRRVVAGFVIG